MRLVRAVDAACARCFATTRASRYIFVTVNPQSDRDGAVRRRELAGFLRSLRERLRPEDVGLPRVGRRRVKGLRREEVAVAAGIGLTWYTRLETGSEINVSRDLLAKVTRALRCSPAERDAVMRLATEASPAHHEEVDDITRHVVDAVRLPAFVLDAHWYVRYWNQLFATVWLIDPPGSAPFHAIEYQVAHAREAGLQGSSWESRTHRMIAQFRHDAAAHAGEAGFDALVRRLSAIPAFDEVFRRREILASTDEVRSFVEHPQLGRFAYHIRSFNPPDSSLTLTVQVVEPGLVPRLLELAAARG